MNYIVNDLFLRRPEPEDLDVFYQQKNSPEIAAMLGGFTLGYARQDLRDWLEYHRRRDDEVIWTICKRSTNQCLGHAGFYHVDFRVRQAEYAILIGDMAAWGKGIGKRVTEFCLAHGFEQMNLNRIYLSLLATNQRALGLYRGLGFRQEGLLRQAQYKDGQYVDVIQMAVLRQERIKGECEQNGEM